jgi:hypothetical protein
MNYFIEKRSLFLLVFGLYMSFTVVVVFVGAFVIFHKLKEKLLIF